MTTSDHLRGPWKAIAADAHGFVADMDLLYDLEPDDEISISIRRGTALPDGEDRLPDICQSGDVICLWGDLYVEDGDPSTDAPARWAQAQAMADGLNAAAGAVAS